MFSLIKPQGDEARLPIEQEVLRLWNPILRGSINVFGEELEHVVPRVNLIEDDKEYRLSAELPGVDEKDVRLRLTQDGLTISGEKKQESEEKGKNAYRYERSFGSFERHFQLPQDIDRTKASASFKRGVLRVTLPKRADAAPQDIRIQSE